ncbi:Rne/Rng family ribonuclease [Defluviicoccus vanus]|uniref:Ribonuclease E n=1 Tax=Defluviicoccus vanus TaxID=111831 RepID=A0A7H1N2H1_9PROT|nr:ribonuclease E/G [Defluviicoccus vanus]QNT69907.1 Rne/Rng family ribonuclease [Defluviicoccus vanus]
MLIDAAHPEETRVVVIDGARLEEFDVEVASRKQLKGNIYLAKITRVEPSLQAAFVDYGGNRHGFLAFNEIHPDYYQIPVADRERLLAEEAALAREAESRAAAEEAEDGEAIDDDDDMERRHLRLPSRHYKIQEVIKRRQIMLVQVAKEERGNKGAALTTYLSLAGRYCVLMPNTARGGGISRKITVTTDRKRLKKILTDLEVPEGMAVIVRTAGSGRSKAEIKRDYEYLMRLWSSIRETTLGSTAPALVYEEGSLIKRSIRDHYERDIEEIIIQGEPEYKIAREFMKLFIPSHAKRVKLYEEPEGGLYQAYNVEDQLDAMHQPVVQLRSGGYLVINPTEALVTIDVNSGRSTRERHIEETALRTNLEASDEIGRQLRLRDLAGLIVIDFIDMEVPRNQALVERRLKDAMKGDRARTQIGRISPFGLLELSRQRMRPSLLETSFEVCPHCRGAGVRRTTESTALAVLRKIEEEGSRHRAAEISVAMASAVANYLLNIKRRSLVAIEDRYDLIVAVTADDSLIPPDCRIERLRGIEARVEEVAAAAVVEEVAAVAAVEDEAETQAEQEDSAKRGRRRRGRRRRRPEDEAAAMEALPVADAGYDPALEFVDEDMEDDEEELDDAGEADGESEAEAGAGATAEPAKKRRRRGKRGGRRRSRRSDDREITGDMAASAPVEQPEDDADIAANTFTVDDEPEDFVDDDEVRPSDGLLTEDAADVVAAQDDVGDDGTDNDSEPSIAAVLSEERAAEKSDTPADGAAAAPAKRPRTRRRTPRPRKTAESEPPAEPQMDLPPVDPLPVAPIVEEPQTAAFTFLDSVVNPPLTGFVPDYRDRAVIGETFVASDPLPPLEPMPEAVSMDDGGFPAAGEADADAPRADSAWTAAEPIVIEPMAAEAIAIEAVTAEASDAPAPASDAPEIDAPEMAAAIDADVTTAVASDVADLAGETVADAASMPLTPPAVDVVDDATPPWRCNLKRTLRRRSRSSSSQRAVV